MLAASTPSASSSSSSSLHSFPFSKNSGVSRGSSQLGRLRSPKPAAPNPICCFCSCSQLVDGEDSHGRPSTGLQAPFGLFLHDLMDQAGIETSHAKSARKNFMKEVNKFANDARSVSIGEVCCLDLARAVLEVSAEDDALVSHSPVALPVDSYLDRLNSMAMEFAGHHMPSQSSTPDSVLSCLDNYLYGYKGFQTTLSQGHNDVRGCYLNMVLTGRVGTPMMLALIYSEIMKILKLWGVVDFIVDMELSKHQNALPHPKVVHHPRATLEASAPKTITPQDVLVEILVTLKAMYWPWKLVNGSYEGSDFLKAANAANHGVHMTAGAPVESLFKAPSNTIGAEVASARAAQHRLQRGIWTSANFGDMRRALAASERLVLLGVDKKELRDYGILLYHCGLYRQSSMYLNEYYQFEEAARASDMSDMPKSREALALESVLTRLRLILIEERWRTPSPESFVDNSLTDPW